MGGKSAGVSVAWLWLGEGFWMASLTILLTEESIIRAKRAPLGWVSPAQVVHAGGGLVQCLAGVGDYGSGVATRTLRMLTSRRCAQAHANGSKHPVLKHGPRSLTYVRVSECEKLSVRNESEGGHLGH